MPQIIDSVGFQTNHNATVPHATTAIKSIQLPLQSKSTTVINTVHDITTQVQSISSPLPTSNDNGDETATTAVSSNVLSLVASLPLASSSTASVSVSPSSVTLVTAEYGGRSAYGIRARIRERLLKMKAKKKMNEEEEEVHTRTQEAMIPPIAPPVTASTLAATVKFTPVNPNLYRKPPRSTVAPTVPSLTSTSTSPSTPSSDSIITTSSLLTLLDSQSRQLDSLMYGGRSSMYIRSRIEAERLMRIKQMEIDEELHQMSKPKQNWFERLATSIKKAFTKKKAVNTNTNNNNTVAKEEAAEWHE